MIAKTVEAPTREAPVREAETVEPDTAERRELDRPWKVIVWNDPINLMSYVTYVFQTLFGYPRAKAHRLMLEVHKQGKSVVWSGTRERAEAYCSALHERSLWATMEQDA